MPSRKKKTTPEVENAQSALFPSGNVDPATKAAFDRMMKVHGYKINQGPLPGPHAPAQSAANAVFPELPNPDPASVPVSEPVRAPEPVPAASPTQVRPDAVLVPVDVARRGKMEAFKTALGGLSVTSVVTVRFSDGREVNFEPPKVKTQKTLNQIIVANEGDPAAQYMAQVALLESVCIDKGIDWNLVSDFDRNKALFALYRDVLFRGEYRYRCNDEKCGFEWMGKLDGKKIIDSLDKSDVSDKRVKRSLGDTEFEFRIGFPPVKSMVAFLTDYASRPKKPGAKDGEIDPVTLMDYIDLFIKEIWVRANGEEVGHISLEDMVVPYGTPVLDENGEEVLDEDGKPVKLDVGQCYRDVEDVLGSLPGSVLQASADDDVYTKIYRMLVGVVNDAMPECVCPKCGNRMGKSFGFNDFFSLG